MKTHLAAASLIAVLAQPAAAITFPTLTTIYVGAGVSEFNGIQQFATAFTCSNVSGQEASVRFLVLNQTGGIAGSLTQTVAHGANATVATSSINVVLEQLLNTGDVTHGTVNIESTQSGVFCSAMVLDPDSTTPNGVALHLVRVNPHPGTVE
jgi:hypothetical protein